MSRSRAGEHYFCRTAELRTRPQSTGVSRSDSCRSNAIMHAILSGSPERNSCVSDGKAAKLSQGFMNSTEYRSDQLEIEIFWQRLLSETLGGRDACKYWP
nr:hypothetical protein CFP56_75587 [Quercus suber]